MHAPATAEALTGRERGARRTAARTLALAHRSGLARWSPVKRLRVSSGHDDSLVAAIEEAVGAGAQVAIRLGSWEHARSLVVRVGDPTGVTLAFGKVGIDPHGRASVRAERRNLDAVARMGLRHVVHSVVLGLHEWRGLDLLLVSPLLAGRGPDLARVPVDAMLELAHHGGPRSGTLDGSDWWRSVRARLDEVEDLSARTTLTSSARRLVAAAEGTPVPLGPWHGDWTAWNMAWDGSRVLLWDWEHFARDVPVGFDLIHHLAQGLRVSRGTGPAAEGEWRSRADDALAVHVGLPRRPRDLVLAAYLLEVNLRFVLDRQGTPQAATRRAGWDLELLRREVGRLAPS